MISRYEQCTTKGRGINEIACVSETRESSPTYPYVGVMALTCFAIVLAFAVITGLRVLLLQFLKAFEDVGSSG